MDASLRCWLPPLSLSLEPALPTDGGGNSSNEEESRQIADERGNCDCEKLRALVRVRHSSLSMAFCVQAAAEMCFKGDINPLLSQMQILQKQEKISPPTFQPSSPTSASSSCFPDFMPNAHSTARQSRPRPRMKEATAKMQSYCECIAAADPSFFLLPCFVSSANAGRTLNK